MPHRSHLLLGATLALCLSAPAFAGDFSLLYPEDGSRVLGPTQDIQMALPEGLSEGELGNLYLELDGIDITQRVSLDGNRVIYSPAFAYTPGNHQLRLLRMGRSGKLQELRNWSFAVAGGPPPQTSSFAAEGRVDSTYSLRAWDNTRSRRKEADVHNLQTLGDVSISAQQGSWNMTATANALLNSESELNPGRNSLEVGEYLLSAQNVREDFSAGLSLGDHDIGASNLLMDQFYRRGISANLDIHQGRLASQAFAMNPASAIGNHNISGIGEHEQVATGVHGSWQPLSSLRDRLELEGTLYRGEGSEDGSGSGSLLSDVSEGNGYQIGLTLGVLPERIKLRTQYALSNFDEDGDVATLRSERDDAYQVGLTITPLSSSTTADGRLQQLEITPSYYRAGINFSSLLNASAERDREIWDIKSNYLLGNLTLDSDISWMSDNVGDIASLPRDGSFQTSLQSSYAPENISWGTPLFSAGGNFTRDVRLETPSGYVGDDLSRYSASLNGGVALSFEKTTWSLNHTYSWMVDQAVNANDFNSHYTDASMSYRISRRLTVQPGMQVEFMDARTGGRSTNLYGSLGIQAELVPAKLFNSTTFSVQDINGFGAGAPRYNFKSDFTWRIRPAQINRPGYALGLTTLFDNQARVNFDGTRTTDDEARVFLRLKLSAPFAHPATVQEE